MVKKSFIVALLLLQTVVFADSLLLPEEDGFKVYWLDEEETLFFYEVDGDIINPEAKTIDVRVDQLSFDRGPVALKSAVLNERGLFRIGSRLRIIPERDNVYHFIGDIQGYKASQYDQYRRIMAAFMALYPSGTVFSAGDLVDNPDSYLEWQQVFQSFDKHLLVATIGNHDAGPVASRLFKNNYVYENQDFLLFTLNTEESFKAQVAALRALDKNHKFLIVLMHRPAYAIKYNEPWVRQLAKDFEEIGVDLVLSGHDHIYSRTTIFENQVVDLDRGVTYVVGGSSSGSKFYNQSETRPWQDLVFDDNLPVMSYFYVKGDQLYFKAFAYKNDQFELIDTFSLEAQ